MSAMARLQHVWTFEDLEALPDDVDRRRYEIVDGALVVSPGPAIRHDMLAGRLLAAISPAVPTGWEAIGSATIDLQPSYRVSDLTVLRSRLFAQMVRRVQPPDILLVVEVVSPGSQVTDRVTKPAQYAAAGIPAYWRVESEPVSLTAYELEAGAKVYTEVGSWMGAEVAHIEIPFAVDIDLSRLGRATC
jgi:Uma2 family endonuclease